MFPDDVDTFPFPITREILERGQERYQIFCSSCHGLTGYGDGMVARRGFQQTWAGVVSSGQTTTGAGGSLL